MVLEAAIRPQRLDSMRESSGTLPSTGVFVPFGDVIKRFSWTPDASMEARRGIGSIDALSHDTGLETHSIEVSYLLEAAMVVAATLDTGVVADADQIKFTAADSGHDGNDITITFVAGTADAGGIAVVNRAITCEVGTAVAGDLCTLLTADTDVAALVSCATTSVTDAASVVQAYAIGTLTAGESTPLSEAFNRDCDDQVEARTIVLREKHCSGGTSSNGLRTYVVGEGCKPASARIPGDPGSAGPIEVGITYTAEKVRHYEISQPSTACVLYVLSSEAADYAATITVEDDDGNQEEIVVSGTGSTVFPNIDAIELASELTGTLTVLEGATSGATLAVVHGSLKYDGTEGDMGVPVIPSSGSRTATIGGTMEKFLGDTITHNAGTMAYNINSVELSVDNSIETLPRNDSRKQRVIEGNRTLQLIATVLGEQEYQRQITRHLQTDESDIVWTLTNTTLTLEGAAMISAPDKTVEEGGAYMQLNTTFEGTAITIA